VEERFSSTGAIKSHLEEFGAKQSTDATAPAGLGGAMAAALSPAAALRTSSAQEAMERSEHERAVRRVAEGAAQDAEAEYRSLSDQLANTQREAVEVIASSPVAMCAPPAPWHLLARDDNDGWRLCLCLASWRF